MNALDLINESAACFSNSSWLQARSYAEQFGRPPRPIESLIRRLLADDLSQPGELTWNGTWMLRRLFRIRAFQAPYFSAITNFRKECLPAEDQPFSGNDFVQAFSAPEHAFITGLIFLHRMARRRADRDLFSRLDERLQRGVNLGWLIGNTLKPVGIEAGMMVGALPWIGLLPFPKSDPYALRSYLRHLRKTGRRCTDPYYETEQWGCSSLQIGLLLMQRMGFGMHKVVPLMRAMITKSPKPSNDKQEWLFRVADVWARHVLEDGDRPSIPLQPSYYLSEERIAELSAIFLKEDYPSEARWLSASRNDLTPQSAPQLFCGLSAEETEAMQRASEPPRPSARFNKKHCTELSHSGTESPGVEESQPVTTTAEVPGL